MRMYKNTMKPLADAYCEPPPAEVPLELPGSWQTPEKKRPQLYEVREKLSKTVRLVDS